MFSTRPTHGILSAMPSLLALVTAMGGCDARERPMPDDAACGAPGTNTVMLETGCFCLAGYVLDASGARCEMEIASVVDGGAVVATDASVEIPDAGHVEGTLREVDTSDGTCAGGCTAVGFPCATSCEEGAGFASYGYYDWDYGFYRGVHQDNLASCTDTPAASYAEAGETYDLGRLVCCCEIPEVTVVSARPDDIRTCDDICTESGHASCANFAEWPSEDAHGGTLATYYRPETGSVTYVVMGCAAHPPATRNIAGAVRELSDYECGCVQ